MERSVVTYQEGVRVLKNESAFSSEGWSVNSLTGGLKERPSDTASLS